jgi:alpha-L-arabinofuranosidase
MTTVTVGTAAARSTDRAPVGINVNHFMDGQFLPSPRGELSAALREMGARYLRFPGGEKSDGYLWSVPPFDRPAPAFARWGGDEIPESFRRFASADGRTMVATVLDFDGFLRVCRDAAAEPVVVLPYDSIYKPPGPGGHAPTREELLATAEAWVSHARRLADEGLPRVRYWELGNESYMRAYNGWATAADYARDLAEWSRRLKRIDPGTALGANGPNGADKTGAADPEGAAPWWKTVLCEAGAEIDFLAIHDYPCWKWGFYDYYAGHTPRFTEAIDAAVQSLERYCSEADRRRIRIAITEMSSVDWFGHPENLGWKHVNTLGHALVLVDMIGRYRSHPRLDFALLWNTRWVENDTAAEPMLWDALRPDGGLNATGMAMALWAGAGAQMHSVDAPAELPAFAASPGIALEARQPDGGADVVVVLVNKGDRDRDVRIVPEVGWSATRGPGGGRPSTAVRHLTGGGPDDTKPRVTRGEAPGSNDGEVTLTLPPCSASSVAIRW